MRIVLACALLLAGCGQRDVPPHTRSRAPRPPSEWLKGQLHAHSDNSGDSRTDPDDVVRWYEDHGYDFLFLTDHNVLAPAPAASGMLVFEAVELTDNEPCEGREQCLAHVNAFAPVDRNHGVIPWARPLFTPLPEHTPLPVRTARDAFARLLETSAALEALPMLNHPNFHYVADADTIAVLVRSHGLRLFEVRNEAVDSANEGDTLHPSTEGIWDDVLSRGLTIFGTATDDAHHYYDAAAVTAAGHQAHVGDRGFVMVRAARDRVAILDALERGDFYGSNGVIFERIEVVDDRLVVETTTPCTFVFKGEHGRVRSTQTGTRAGHPIEGAYLRVVATDERGRFAFSQPFRP